jgi:hypothetical protein
MIGINLRDTKCVEAKEYSDKELVEIYLVDEGKNDYDKLVINSRDKYISYMTFDDDNELPTHVGSINRSYYTHKYE